MDFAAACWHAYAEHEWAHVTLNPIEIVWRRLPGLTSVRTVCYRSAEETDRIERYREMFFYLLKNPHECWNMTDNEVLSMFLSMSNAGPSRSRLRARP